MTFLLITLLKFLHRTFLAGLKLRESKSCGGAVIVSGYGRGQQNEILQAERLVSLLLCGQCVGNVCLVCHLADSLHCVCIVQGGIHPDMIMLAIGEEITFGRSFDEVIIEKLD